MKKSLMLTAVVALMSSCEKDRVCVCDTTDAKGYTTYNTKVITYPDQKKKSSKANCETNELKEPSYKMVVDTNTNYVSIELDPATGEKVIEGYTVIKCEIK